MSSGVRPLHVILCLSNILASWGSRLQWGFIRGQSVDCISINYLTDLLSTLVAGMYQLTGTTLKNPE